MSISEDYFKYKLRHLKDLLGSIDPLSEKEEENRDPVKYRHLQQPLEYRPDHSFVLLSYIKSHEVKDNSLEAIKATEDISNNIYRGVYIEHCLLPNLTPIISLITNRLIAI